MQRISLPKMLFQSTPSYEGERSYRKQKRLENAISIHSLIRGRTVIDKIIQCRSDISIHSLIRGRTGIPPDMEVRLKISIHSLIRGRTVARQKIPRKAPFQSTPSYEGELVPSMSTVPIASDFNPLPHTRENFEIEGM